MFGEMLMIKKCAVICWLLLQYSNAQETGALNFTKVQPKIIGGSAVQTGAAKCHYNENAPFRNLTLQIRLPLMDMLLQQEHNVYIISEPERSIVLVLHGYDLFQLFVSRQDKRLIWLGTFWSSRKNTGVQGIAVISWHDYLLIAVALEETVEIYQISIATLAKHAGALRSSNAEPPPPLRFEVIQQLMMPGKLRQLQLLKPTEQSVMLIIATNFTKLHGKYKSFEWLDTYFNPVEEVTLPAIHMLQIVGSYPKYILIGRVMRSQPKTMLTTYQVQVPGMKLQRKQALAVDSHSLHAFTFHKRNYIVACARPLLQSQTQCSLYRMSSDGQFSVYKQLASKDISFNKLLAGKHVLIATRQREVLIFASADLDCYVSYSAKELDVSTILTHTNANNETFVLLTYQRPFNTLLRMVELETETGGLLANVSPLNYTEQEDMNSLRSHRHLFEETIGRLRSLLLQRKSTMDIFRRANRMMASKVLRLKATLTVHGGRIGSVRLMAKNVRSPMQLVKLARSLRNTYARRRSVRSFGSGNGTTDTIQSLKVQRLRVKNLIYTDSLIEGYQLDNQTQPLPILSIRPMLETKVLRTQTLMTSENYRHRRALNGTKRLLHLNVQRINNISWSDFYDGLFLRVRDMKIHGRLILQADTQIGRLHTSLLNDLVVKQLFNLKQPQVVQSTIALSGFFVSELFAEEINGLDFEKEIVFHGKNTLIETPVKIYEMSVAGDILFANETHKVRSSSEEQQLQQYYTGKVHIDGSLILDNLLIESVDTRLLLENTSFATHHLQERYLLKDTSQSFDYSINFGNAKLRVPRLITEQLNEHALDEHLLSSGRGVYKQPLFVIFMQASIDGDVICKDYTSKLRQLALNTVRHGEAANITGHKHFKATLSIDDLSALKLNDIDVKDLILKSHLPRKLQFSKPLSFSHIVIGKEVQVKQALNASFLNNLPLDEMLNYDYHMQHLQLSYPLRALNVIFHHINGISFDDIFAKLRVQRDMLVLSKNLEIVGDVKFIGNLAVKTVNKIDWPAYAASLVHVNEQVIELRGRISFLRDVTITADMQAPTINGQHMAALFENTLLTTKAQTITGDYSIAGLRTTNLDVVTLNDIPAVTLIDTRLPRIVLQSDLVVPKLSIAGNLQGRLETGLDLNRIEKDLRALQAKQWRNLVVMGDVQWNTSDTSATELSQQYAHLAYLLRNAVTRSGYQHISGNVRLLQPIITEMFTKSKFPKQIDFAALAKDALLKQSMVPQLVLADKIFHAALQLKNIYAKSDIKLNSLNSIEIWRLNASLYRLSSGRPIAGKLRFLTAPIIGRLALQGRLNGIASEQIYQQHAASSLPILSVRQITLENKLTVGVINGMNLNYLLQNRVPLHGDALEVFGTLTFEQLILKKKILLRTINSIPLDNLVYKHSSTMQAITGSKMIAGSLLLDGPAHVMLLNGRNLGDIYQRSIFNHENLTLDSLTLDAATFQGGFEFTNNNMVAATLEETLDNPSNSTSLIRELIAVNNVLASNQSVQQTHLSYLDYEPDMQLLWQAAPANVSIDFSYLHASSPNIQSNCLRHWLRVQLSMQQQSVYLQNVSSNLISRHANELSLKVENYCKFPYPKVHSKIVLTCRNTSHTLGMKKFVETIEIYEPVNDSNSYVLLHAYADIISPKRNEIRVLKQNRRDCNISDWQSLRHGVGKTMKLFQLDGTALLITSGMVEHHALLSLYFYKTAQQQFVLSQQIAGDYDIIELVMVSNKKSDSWPEYQLILSCRHCQRIAVYAYRVDAEQPFEFIQMIKFSTHIDRLLPFTLRGRRYMLVLAEHSHGYYYLFKYAHIEGWLQHTYGYFHDTQMAVPLMEANANDLNDNNLMLLCNRKRCGLVKIIMK